MKVAVAAIAVAVMTVPAVGANAQDTDAQIMAASRNPAIPRGAADEQFVHDFAACAVRNSGSYAEEAMRELPNSRAADRDLFWVATLANSCAPTDKRLKFSPRMLRGSVAEYFFHRDFGAGATDAHPLKLFTTPSNEKLDKLDDNERAAVVMVEVGECVAQHDMAGVRALLDTTPATDAEGQAFGALMPTLSGCLPPKVQLKMGKFQMRGYLAEGAYRVAAKGDAEGSAG